MPRIQQFPEGLVNNYFTVGKRNNVRINFKNGFAYGNSFYKLESVVR